MSTMTANEAFQVQDLQLNEFDYRPTPIIVPISMTLAVISAASLLGIVGIMVAIIGMICSVFAVLTIFRSEGAYSGKWVAILALVISFTFGIVGISMQAYAFSTEVPDGYYRTSFSQDISAKGFVVEEGQMGLHPDVEALIDQQIFLKGYMYPQRQTEGLTEFLLLKDTGECCFGGQPQPTDMILVKMQTEQGTDYRQGRVAIAGTLRLTRDTTPEGLQPVYAIEAILCERSRSAF